MDYQLYEVQTAHILIFILLLLAILALLFVFIVGVLLPFAERRKYIKMEMRRSEGAEYEYWKKKLKRHYIRHIPLVGKILLRLMR